MAVEKVEHSINDVILIARMTTAEVAAHHINGGGIVIAKKPTIWKISGIARDSVWLLILAKHLLQQAH